MSAIQKWTLVLNGFAIGNLCTSAAFYASFDNWKPLVWSAGINAAMFVTMAIVRVLNDY